MSLKPIFRTINGWNVLFQPKPSAQTVNLRAVVNAGSAHESDPKHFGVAHFLEHMFFKGTHQRSYSEINRQFAQLGDVNAYTTLERTVFYLTTLPEKIEMATELFMELFFDARMPPEEFEKERGVILEEFQSSEDNPISWGVKKINWDTWGAALHPTIGTRESIESMNIEDLVDFKTRYYHPERTLFVITGDLDPARLWSALETHIRPSRAKLDAAQRYQPSVQFQTQPYQLENPNSKQSLLFLIFPTVNEATCREMRFLPELVVNLIGGGMHSVLFESIREKLGLCYAVGMQYMTPCSEGYHSVYALLDAVNVKTAYQAVLEEFAQLQKAIDPGLFETAKSNLLFGRSRAAETASGVGAQADGYFDNGNQLIAFEEYRNGIQSCTIPEVQHFISTYLQRPKLAVVNAQLPG
jgi:predicted Zn-dependent peptidase